ncbi:Hypothetical predicted protein [Marmota monax]|uniref:Uncharacterized protein n=1 Tax=Marmota monax TaxID=9995 RepID=A0A5E4BCT1_MARMO|nr:hypothetical protein GHT09_014102 [Marmota monax]KAF7475087.1 hypothetical protein GHT09_014102 [Marmota monax]KAF7475088.1 hypothetical protein GHT09_014102 [Marmota monax]VTJ67155.1 Hypothetical predicted protein [Marmota monax]
MTLRGWSLSHLLLRNECSKEHTRVEDARRLVVVQHLLGGEVLASTWRMVPSVLDPTRMTFLDSLLGRPAMAELLGQWFWTGKLQFLPLPQGVDGPVSVGWKDTNLGSSPDLARGVHPWWQVCPDIGMA